jgi:anti-sigma regulatory factor (Ser/Thr protein kinase)
MDAPPPDARRERRVTRRNASIYLPPTAGSVSVARHLVLELLRAWGVPHDREDAALLVTELVSNVVDHVGGTDDLTLEVGVSDDRLRIAVVDGSSIRPVVQELSHDRPRGRGIRMVQAIADRWGTDAHGSGKRVWLELRPLGR